MPAQGLSGSEIREHPHYMLWLGLSGRGGYFDGFTSGFPNRASKWPVPAFSGICLPFRRQQKRNTARDRFTGKMNGFVL